jgi:hypothetical protein
MIEYDTTNTPCKIVIPVSSPKEILRYQQGVLGILSKIGPRTIDLALKEDIKTVYNLLDHLHCKDNLEQLLKEANITPERIRRVQKMLNRNR